MIDRATQRTRTADLLSADLEVAPPRGEVKIGLGVEQAIKVSRNTTTPRRRPA